MKLENACDRIYLGVCDEMNVFFDAFINQLPKIHRRALRKIKIDLLCFWKACDVIYKKNVSPKYALFMQNKCLYIISLF